MCPTEACSYFWPGSGQNPAHFCKTTQSMVPRMRSLKRAPADLMLWYVRPRHTACTFTPELASLTARYCPTAPAPKMHTDGMQPVKSSQYIH